MARVTIAGIGMVALALSASPVLAANARHPYTNVDKRIDHGGDTGDSRVEMLNQQQLDAARSANGRQAPMSGSPMLGAPLRQPGMGQ